MTKKQKPFQWHNAEDSMSPGQVESVLNGLGLEVYSESDTNYSLMCPFHDNRITPALSMDKASGLYYCFGAGCEARGRLVDFVKSVKRWDTMRSLRFIEKSRTQQLDVDAIITEYYATTEELPLFPVEVMKKMQEYFSKSERAQTYLLKRNIKATTAQHFGVGYDKANDMTTVPMYDKDNRLVGCIGRSIEGKRFKNSKDLPTRKTLFNINNAKRAGVDFLVLCESSMDAMRIHQAGYPNVCATLGGTFSKYHVTLINRYFNSVILLIDADEPGKKFAGKISKTCRESGLSVKQAMYSELIQYPHDAKDAGDMTDKEIAHVIRKSQIM